MRCAKKIMKKNLKKMLLTVLAMAAMIVGSFQAFAAESPEKEQMMQEIYNGVMNSPNGNFQTSGYYSVEQWPYWGTEILMKYFYAYKIDTFWKHSTSGKSGVQIRIDGTENFEKIKEKEMIAQNEILKVVNQVAGKSKEEQIRFFYDYIINNCTYDYTYQNYSVYDCLINGNATCMGYTSAFYNLCRTAGIESEYILGKVDVNEIDITHTWNRVKMDDGNWYYLDITWDDNLGTNQYYMISEEQMNQNHIPVEYHH